jgi:hypothetical protein
VLAVSAFFPLSSLENAELAADVTASLTLSVTAPVADLAGASSLA